MIYKTHSVAALIGAEVWLIHTHQPVLSWQTAVALLGAYFAGPAADVDQPQSYVGQRVWPLSIALSGLGIRHRTLTHSLLFLAGLWVALQFVPIPNVIRWALWIGYASHPFIDLFNEEGVELLWPFRVRIHLLPRFLSIPVESFAETLLRGVMTLCSYCLLTLYLHPVVTQLPLLGPISDGIIRWMPSAILTFIE